MPHCDTLIHAAIIVTQNESRNILREASLAIEKGRIKALGPTEEISRLWTAEKVLDLQNSLLMPGLINAHTHTAMTFLRGYADDLPLLEWLQTKIFPQEAKLNPEIVRLASLLGYAEMLSSGVTACVDMYLFEEAVLEAADIAGIRCLGGEAVFAFPTPACANYREALDKTIALAEKYSSSSRIGIAVNPHSVYTTNREILSACRDLALKHNLPLHIHLAESKAESSNSRQMHKMRPVAWAYRNGLMDCRLIAAHLVDLLPEEIDLLAHTQVIGVHNPSSNMKLASGISPVPDMLEAGMTLALGTDGPASNNNLNVFQEMKMAAFLHKVVREDPSTLPAGTLLDMATINGAKAMAYTDLGILAPGMRADCVALDLKLPNMLPLHQPVSQLVYAANGRECQMTMIEGEIVYQDGRLTRFDFAALRDEFSALRKFVERNQ